jgi:hypothetical protein
LAVEYEYLVTVEGSMPEQPTERFTHKSSYRIEIEDLRPVIAEGFAHFTVLEVVEQAEPGTKVGRLRAKRRTSPNPR